MSAARAGWRTFKRARLMLRLRAARGGPLKIVVGSAGVPVPGWIITDVNELDLLRPSTWAAFMAPGSVDALFAEHVWEHLRPADAVLAARTCFTFLRPGGVLRVAVPDGLHPDPAYLEAVRPGGTGPGADDHQVLYTHATLRAVFEEAGFSVTLLEHFDEDGVFQQVPWSSDGGHVLRSARHDPRNHDGTLRYTSIILDAQKK